MSDPFEAAYLAGVPAALPAPAVAARPHGAPPAEPFALTGCVVTPDDVLDPGCVVVADGAVSAVQAAPPAGVRVQATDGVICPGLIDLHGHPEFNVFAAWEPPQEFINRYQWRQSKLYHQLVRDPQNTLKDAVPDQTQLRYAEVRALVSGVTAIQGTSELVTRLTAESLVRNVDKWIFGRHRARALVDLPSATGQGKQQLDGILADIASHDVDAFYIHLAEGQKSNPRSQAEFDALVGLGALTAATVVIHGTALTRDQLGHLKDAGAKLVWSPQSNLRLYGETTDVAAALDIGLSVALGADWLPSGSPSLLAEITVARRCLIEQGHPLTARQLVQMVTSGAAAIAGLGDQLGTLAPGRPADVVVFERRNPDPYENIVAAEPSWVELVLIGGDLTYGRADWITALSDDPTQLQPLIAWGQPMLLDTGYVAEDAGKAPAPAPTLAQLRAALIGAYPQVGPIFV
jgi:cytosine/adenosine deaminase-related metal-dependent hydrolase